MNDQILGFFHSWIEEFSKHAEKVTVICLEKGDYSLPENVSVISLGKESGAGKISYVLSFYKNIFLRRKDYDHVFVHMNQIYIILGGLVWKLMNKKVSLWYAHGHVSLSLRFAEKIVNTIVTSTERGFRLKSDKVKVVGQGIDENKFAPNKLIPKLDKRILTVGRVSKVKNVHIMLDVLSALPDYRLDIVGDSVTEVDVLYLKDCNDRALELGVEQRVVWHGSKTQSELITYYQQSTVFLNLSETGSLDKVILEAMFCNLPVVTSNQALEKFPVLYVDKPDNITEVLSCIKSLEGKACDVRGAVIEDNSLQNLIPKIMEVI